MLGQKSIIQKVWGFFTFVNIIWMLSIFGLAISVGPCLYEVIGPCVQRFMTTVFDIIQRMVVWLLQNIVIPLVTFLHDWGVFEILMYMLSFQLIREGSLMNI